MASTDGSETVGVVGSGSFGVAITSLLQENCKSILLYSRSESRLKKIREGGLLDPQVVQTTTDLQQISERCHVLFVLIPSTGFRDVIRAFSPFLKPSHIIIHGTKGIDIQAFNRRKDQRKKIFKHHLKTMSQVIAEETVVVRRGCLVGPNLASEIIQKMPAATVVASEFDEVIRTGVRLLRCERFQVYGSNDILGIELCGVLKNIIALGTGAIHGLELGENAKSLFISRGLVEMVHIGKLLGGNVKAFFGLAGVGDLIATCSSPLSRNFTVGLRLARGERIEDIIGSMEETAEGVHTISIINDLSESIRFKAPITHTLYKVINRKMDIAEASAYLMKLNAPADVDFMD